MAAAVPEPIARTPFHNTHRAFLFYFIVPAPGHIHGGENHCPFTTCIFKALQLSMGEGDRENLCYALE
jgi:nitrite reductase/ring-hydroxylating ferredoxin subunit